MDDRAPKKTPTWVIVMGVLAALGLLGIVALGIMAALAVSGTKKYLASAKGAEGRAETVALATGLATCFELEKELPPTAPPVPATLAEVRGKKYLSSSVDWNAPAYKCARFGLTTAQYYRYQWVRTNAAEGTVLGEADLDGDGKIDDAISVHLTCTPRGSTPTCTVGVPVVGGVKTAPP